MADETKKTYTIRLPEEMAARVEAQAASMKITPTTLLQALVVRPIGGASQDGADNAPVVVLTGKLEAIRKAYERIEQAQAERCGQLLFEIVKTRSALFHSLDQNLGAAAVDEIIEASEKAARQYIARLAEGGGTRR